jgi:hypothetical protein
MNRFLAALLMLFATTASAQQFVTVIGPVGPGNCPIFNSTTTLKDSGGPCAVGVGGTVTGPITSTVNGLALWNNLVGGTLKDGPGQTVAGNYTWSGAQNVTVTDPIGLGPNQRQAFQISSTYDNNITSNPGFVFNNAMEVDNSSLFGDYNYGNLTFSKSTFLNVNYSATHYGSGQHDIYGANMTCYGQGDCSIGQQFVTFANYPSNGDEGTGFGLVSQLLQVSPTQLATVVSTSKNTCNTTLNQAVTGSATQQTVNVINGAGCTANTWIVVNREQATGSNNHEGVQIISSTSTSITAIFRANYNNGMTITPALDMITNGGGPPGQGRLLVNISATPYTTGTIASISGGALTGSGTGWTVGMVGGDTINPGCLNMAADDFAGSPFGAGNNTLHSYFKIYNFVDATHLGIFSFSAAGSTAYNGKGPGSGAYRVLPCSEVVRVLSGTEIILADSNFTWTNGQTIEYAIPPYPDVAGFQYHFAVYTSGGTYRTFFDIDNVGARKFLVGVQIRNDQGPIANNLAGADNNAYGIGLNVESADIGLCVNCSGGGSHVPTVAGLAFNSLTAAAGRIQWGTGGSSGFIQSDPTAGFELGMLGSLSTSVVTAVSRGAIGSGTFDELLWSGGLLNTTVAAAGANIPTCGSNIEGALMNIPDASTVTWGATVTNFGSSGHALIRCNGTNWTVVGK